MATAMLHKAQKDGSPLLLSPDYVVSLLTFLWFYSQKGLFLSLGYTPFISLSQQETDMGKTPKHQIIGKNFEPCVRACIDMDKKLNKPSVQDQFYPVLELEF